MSLRPVKKLSKSKPTLEGAGVHCQRDARGDHAQPGCEGSGHGRDVARGARTARPEPGTSCERRAPSSEPRALAGP